MNIVWNMNGLFSFSVIQSLKRLRFLLSVKPPLCLPPRLSTWRIPTLTPFGCPLSLCNSMKEIPKITWLGSPLWLRSTWQPQSARGTLWCGVGRWWGCHGIHSVSTLTWSCLHGLQGVKMVRTTDESTTLVRVICRIISLSRVCW